MADHALPPYGFRCPKCGSPSPSTPHIHPTSISVEHVDGHQHRHATEAVDGTIVVCEGQPQRGTWLPDPPTDQAPDE